MSGTTKKTHPVAEKKASQLVVKRNPFFQIGHERQGGRKKGTAAQVRVLCAEMDVDPMEFLLSVIKNGTAESTVIENGKKRLVTISVSLELRLDAAKHVSRFCYPVLSATAVTGKDGGPVAVAALDVAAILANPLLADAAQQLALMVVEQEILEEGRAEPDYRYLKAS